MLSSQDGLCFRDIHSVPMWCSLRMQQVSLHNLKCLIEHKAFKLEGINENLYSHSMVILLILLSDDVLTTIKHMHIGLIVHCMGSNLFNQNGILPFINCIESDLKEVRELCAQGKEVGRVRSYTCLVANYGGIMALPTDPPYCLVYPTVYDNSTKEKTHFNTVGCQSGMRTEACMCHSLLHLMDTDPANRQKFKGNRILVHRGMQYKFLFPIIAELCNHRGPLMDPNTGEPYPMEVAGNFCLKDAFFPSCPGDSVLFHTSELAELAEQGYCIPTYQESTGSSKTHQSSHPKENSQKPPRKDEESSKHSSRILGTSLPQFPDSTSTSTPLLKSKLSPTSKEQKDKCDQEKHSPWPREQQDKCDCEGRNFSTRPKESSCSKKDRQGQ